MLDIVKQTIAEVPKEPFSEFFMNYVMEVQDNDISGEINAMIHSSMLSIQRICKRIDTLHKEM